MPHTVSRRQVLALGTAIAAGAALGGPARAQNRVILNVIPATEPSVLSAGIATQDAPQNTTGGKVLQSLLRVDENFELEGELAESWSVSDDGTVYTFTLRQGVTWHDGKPFTADDVLFSYDSILRQTHGRWAGTVRRIAKMEAPDSHTVRITLTSPFLPFLTAINSVNAPILPKHLYEGTDFRQNPANNAPIGTGPFKFNEWKRGEYIHLVRNDAYWGEGPKVDDVYFHFIPDSAQRAIAMETGRADVALRQVITSNDLRRLTAAGKAEAVDARAYAGLGAASMLYINQRRAPFTDPRVRRALIHALDRQLIIDNAFLGDGTVQMGPILSTSRYFDRDAVTFYEYDPKVKALLAEAGIVPGSLAFSIDVVSTSSERTRMMEIIAQQYSEVGIKATIAFGDAPTVQKKGAEFDFDLQFATVSEFQDPAIGTSRVYLSSGIVNVYGNNIAGYSNAKVDELWAKAETARSVEEAKGYYSEIQRLITADAAYVWLLETQDHLVVRPGIRNMYQGPLSAYYSWAEVEKA